MFLVVKFFISYCSFSGHDTTATNMSFSLYLMASHPKIQEKCREELRDIFGEDTDRAATSGDLANMRYLEMCVKESLRLYQSVPFISRSVPILYYSWR